MSNKALGNFTSFNDCQIAADEKLQALHHIRDRRLNEHVSSSTSQRMQAVCDLIPNCLENLDLSTTGWHRGCHHRFTMNLNRLTQAPSTSSTTIPAIQTHHQRPTTFHHLSFSNTCYSAVLTETSHSLLIEHFI